MAVVMNAGPLQHLRTLLRIAAGPLAFVGFFLPWAHGPSVLAATRFSGFTLVGYTGRLQALDLPLIASGTLLLVRLIILMVAIAALWLALLAPRHRWHRAYLVSGWYLAITLVLALLIGILKSGVDIPPSGLLLWTLGALAFLFAEYSPKRDDG